jgi:hypothetical protein
LRFFRDDSERERKREREEEKTATLCNEKRDSGSYLWQEADAWVGVVVVVDPVARRRLVMTMPLAGRRLALAEAPQKA